MTGTAAGTDAVTHAMAVLYTGNGMIKPLLWQERDAVSLVSKVNPDDDTVFFTREFLWGLEARGAVGYGPWWLISKHTGGAINDLAPDGSTYGVTG